MSSLNKNCDLFDNIREVAVKMAKAVATWLPFARAAAVGEFACIIDISLSLVCIVSTIYPNDSISHRRFHGVVAFGVTGDCRTSLKQKRRRSLYILPKLH